MPVIFICKGQVETVFFLVRVNEELVGLFRGGHPVALRAHHADRFQFYAFDFGIFLAYTIGSSVIFRRPAFFTGREVHCAKCKLTVRVALDLIPVARCGIFFLQHKLDRVLLLICQTIVSGKTLGNVDTDSLRVAAHFQHIVIKICIDTAVTVTIFRIVRDQEVQ